MVNDKPRIENTDSFAKVIKKLGEGYPGAEEVLLLIQNNGDGIDDAPNSTAARLIFIQLDRLGFYGANIWKLYCEVCDEDIACFLAVLHAERMELLPWAAVVDAIERRGGVDVYRALQQVRECLPGFGGRLPS